MSHKRREIPDQYLSSIPQMPWFMEVYLALIPIVS
jgi:hypothetical protein